MSTIEYIHTLIAYNYALYDRVWESITQLTDEQFVEEINYSTGSIRNHLVHVAVTDKRWLLGIQEEPQARAFNLDPADYPDREAVRVLWHSISDEVKQYVASLEQAELERYPQGMSGPVWQVLLHVVNHGTDHRAQILRVLHDFGASTFDQDLVLHLWFD